MALENAVAKYEIQVAKTGTGAVEAAAEIKSLQQTVATANTAFSGLTVTGRSATLAFRAFSNSLSFMGVSVLPQLALGAHAAEEGWRALELSGASAAASFAKTTAITTIVATAIYELATGVTEARNQFSSLKTVQDNIAQDNALIDKLRKQMAAMREAGEITQQQFEELQKALSKPAQVNLTDWQTVLNKVGLATQEELKAFSESADKTKASIEAVSGALHKLKDEASSPQMQIGLLKTDQAHEDALAANIKSRGTPMSGDSYSEADREKDYQRVLGQTLAMETLIDDLEHKRSITAIDAIRLRTEADTKELQQLTQIHKQLTDVQQVEMKLAKDFASGLGNAFVDIASHTKDAKSAMEEFAASFTKEIANMIMQAVILATIQEALGMSGGKSFSELFMGNLAGKANGGMNLPGGATLLAAGGMSVYSPTFLPRFNVVAGEAGHEVLSVLSKPRFLEVGGLSAIVGNMGGRRIALTDANDLAAGAAGAGGRIVVEVQGTPDFEARVVSNSVKGAVHEVTSQMGQQSRLSRVTRQATRSS